MASSPHSTMAAGERVPPSSEHHREWPRTGIGKGIGIAALLIAGYACLGLRSIRLPALDFQVEYAVRSTYFLIIVAAVVFAPAGVALLRRHQRSGLIMIANLLSGWTLVGWLAVACWAFWGRNAKSKLRWREKPKTVLSVFLVLAALMILITEPARTPPFHSHPEGVASLEQVTLGGEKQWILIRGEDQRKPVLLFLHGGPGLALMPLAHALPAELEKDFVVVHWDQRNAGKSYSLLNGNEEVNEQRMIEDAHDLIQLLRMRFHQDKIYLVGHSWGTYLGMLLIERYPDLFNAYIGVGQMGDQSRAAALQDRFIRERSGAVTTSDHQRHGLLMQLGGDYHGSPQFSFIAEALQAPEYDLGDYIRYVAGLLFYNRHTSQSFRSSGPAGRVTRVNVPVYFFLGRYDAICPAPLAEDFLNRLQAPEKHVVWFENSAHWAFLEEPDHFVAAMRQVTAQASAWTPAPRKPSAQTGNRSFSGFFRGRECDFSLACSE